MRRLRKTTIFRVYLLVMCCSFVVAGFGALAGQRRFYSARLDRLEDRLASVSYALSSSTNLVQSPTTVSQPDPRSSDLFWIEGHGTNRRWAYLDICFPDGYRARYYFRPWPSRSELVALHRRLTHDAQIHSFVIEDDDS